MTKPIPFDHPAHDQIVLIAQAVAEALQSQGSACYAQSFVGAAGIIHGITLKDASGQLFKLTVTAA